MNPKKRLTFFEKDLLKSDEIKDPAVEAYALHQQTFFTVSQLKKRFMAYTSARFALARELQKIYSGPIKTVPEKA